MLLVQDQYTQSRKNFDNEFQVKQNTSKQVFADSKEVWEAESGCEEEIHTSGNDSDGDDILYADPSDIPEEMLETRRQMKPPRKKNVRFGGPNFNSVIDTSETSSFDNEYLGMSCGYLEEERRRSLSQEPDMANQKAKDQFRTSHKARWQAIDCGFDKVRPQSSPEKIAGFMEGMEKRQMSMGDYGRHRMKRREHRCPRHRSGEYDFDELSCRRLPNRSYKFESGDDARCCDHCIERKAFLKIKPSQHKHVCYSMSHSTRDAESEVKTHRKMRFDSHATHCQEECDHYTKTRKKTLEAVQEQQEQFSDSTYKVPCSKLSSQTIPEEFLGCPRKKSLDKLTNTSVTDWFYCNSRAPPKVHKTRSRRTRMNRVKNGWKKALVQTVRDGSRNERVGVLVMGSKGPEFYAKNMTKPEVVPFRKSKSFLEGGGGKSFDVMTVDCKNVFLSSSEPGPRASHAFNDVLCPEEDVKVEEKIARYSKNVSEIVKNSEEKFYKALSSSDYFDNRNPSDGIFKGAGEGLQEEKKEEKAKDLQKLSPEKFPLFKVFSPRATKSSNGPEKKISEDSKAMAAKLNEQGKQYLENQSKCKEESYLEGLKELKEKFPPKEISKEAAEANLSVWGMKLDQLSEKTEQKDDSREEGGTQQTEHTHNSEGADIPQRVDRVKPWDAQTTKTHPSGDGDPISTAFRELMENQMPQEEFSFRQGSFHQEVCSNEVLSSSSSEAAITREGKLNVSPRSPKSPISLEGRKKLDREKKEDFLEQKVSGRKAAKDKNCLKDRTPECKKAKEAKPKKKTEDKMKILRQALPSIAAENEAAHLRQLKRYIDKFIDRVEASTASEFSSRKDARSKECPSSDSSEVRVDARKIFDFVSNPFKKISSDVTINIAKKLTDALVQDRTRCPKSSSPEPRKEHRKHSENEMDEEGFPPCNASSGSDRFEEPEPSYLKQLKKMRNEHLNNILLEVKRLSELLRFLDRCNRLHS